MGVSIRDIDYGYTGIMENVRRLKNLPLKVGVDDRPHAPSGRPTDEIGTFHEFGYGTPQRSFLRAWVDENRPEIEGKMGEYINAMIDGGEGWRKPFGKWAVQQIKDRIEAGLTPPLADSTPGRGRLSTVPLIDSGQLVAAIVYEIEGFTAGTPNP